MKRVRHREKRGIALRHCSPVCLVPKPQAQRQCSRSTPSPRVPAGHCCLLSPCRHQFRKRVLCPRPGAQRMIAQAGCFPTEWPPVPSRGAIQAGLAGSEGLLAAQPWSGHRAQGRAGHTPLCGCPVGHGWGCKARSRRDCPHPTPGWETEARGLAQALLLCCLWHPQSWQPVGVQHTVCAEPLARRQANSEGL